MANPHEATVMLSILIPIFNEDSRDLVHALIKQCSDAGIAFEILCFDDGSDEMTRSTNRELMTTNNVRYEEMPENLGRAAIRNQMVRASTYNHLLLIDGDSAMEDDRYITRYLPWIGQFKVVYGGRTYQRALPDDPSLHLHWIYGSQREALPANQRKGYARFMTNNVLIPKKALFEHPLNETLKGYGHEDTLLGQSLEAAGIPIIHIDNPLRHAGLENRDHFLQKTRTGIHNLLKIRKLGADDREITLLMTYRRLKTWKMAGVARFILRRLKPTIQQRLSTNQPNLFWFDMFKLQYLLDIVGKQKV
ncbi:MAG: glycosyltransferase family 2 protein [Flavobacteriales bacterium]|nr:glycosyltransferase family 2 protein [Flavobacteriales bacterium]